MIRKFMLFCFGIFVGAIGMWSAFTYHLVRTKDGVLLIPRTEVMLTNAVVDVREWGIKEWKGNWNVTQAMLKAGYRKVIQESMAARYINSGDGDTDADRTSAIEDFDSVFR